jgi:hypothetical protein
MGVSDFFTSPWLDKILPETGGKGAKHSKLGMASQVMFCAASQVICAASQVFYHCKTHKNP